MPEDGTPPESGVPYAAQNQAVGLPPVVQTAGELTQTADDLPGHRIHPQTGVTDAEGWDTSDPVPPEDDAGADKWQEYEAALESRISSTLKHYTELGLRAETLWVEFLEDFNEKGISSYYSEAQIRAIRDFLVKNDAYCRREARFPRKASLLECYNSATFPGTPSQKFAIIDTSRETVDSPPNEENAAATVFTGQRSAQTNHTDQVDHPSNRAIVARVQEGKQSDSTVVVEQPPSKHGTGAVMEPGGDEEYEYRALSARPRYGYDNPKAHPGENPNAYQRRVPGVQTLIRMHQGREKFTGAYTDDLEARIREYEALCSSCGVNDDEKASTLIIMLSNDALDYYISNFKAGKKADDVFAGLRNWFTSPEQRQRLLQDWLSLTFDETLRSNPEASEANCFLKMCSKLSALQRQLEPEYHHDVLLKDRIVTAMNCRQEIIKTLRVYPPATAQQAQQRIASLLPKNSRGVTASAYFVDRRFVRSVPAASNRSPKPEKGRKISCWVCNSPHLARERHSREEIKEALRSKVHYTDHKIDEEDISFAYGANLQDGDNSDSDGGGELADEDRSISHLTKSIFAAENAGQLGIYLDQAFVHGLQATKPKEAEMKLQRALRYDEGDGFLGVAVDSACVGKSVIGISQAKAYCREYGSLLAIDDFQTIYVTYGEGETRSMGTMEITFMIPGESTEFSVLFHVVRSDIPALLSLDDMDRLHLSLHTLERELVYTNDDKHPKSIVLMQHPKHRLLFFKWPVNQSSVLYTVEELRKLHRAFGHRSVDQIAKVLQRARPDSFNSSTRKALVEIAIRCDPCQRLASRPRRFKLTTGTEDLQFNSSVLADIMYIHARPVLHIIDEATHFTAARFMRNMSASETWKVLRGAWCDVYLGPPDNLTVDAGTQFTSNEFQSSCSAAGITVEEIPVESPWSLSIIERYHGPLRVSYLKLEQDLPGVDPDELLSIATKAVNSE